LPLYPIDDVGQFVFADQPERFLTALDQALDDAVDGHTEDHRIQ